MCSVVPGTQRPRKVVAAQQHQQHAKTLCGKGPKASGVTAEVVAAARAADTCATAAVTWMHHVCN